MKGLPAMAPLLNIPTARHFEKWLSINMVAKRGSQGPSSHNGASKAAAIRPAQTAIITDEKYLTGSSAGPHLAAPEPQKKPIKPPKTSRFFCAHSD